ncbi:MAG TPA: response regulator, partial [Methylomirabilota bacterium]|nr:response regulator [Methylomirabilota bacterium]
EVFRRLREAAADVPVVMVSGNDDPDRARALLTGGAFDYLPKPVSLTTLERVLAAAVGGLAS